MNNSSKFQKKYPHKSEKFFDKDDPYLKSMFKEIRKHPVLPKAEILQLIPLAQSGDDDARHKISESNYGLLVRIAHELAGPSVSMADLIQEGFFGLNTAIDKYVIGKNTPFGHYAGIWIRMAMIKYIWWNKTTIRLPESQRRGIKVLVKVSEEYLRDYGRIPTVEELLEETHLTEKMVKNFCNIFSSGKVKPTENIDELEGAGIQIPDQEPTPEELVDREIRNQALSKCLDTLRPNQAEFLRKYYGIGMPAVSVQQLAEEIGSSLENIRQKRARLVGFLQQNCLEDLSPYLDID